MNGKFIETVKKHEITNQRQSNCKHTIKKNNNQEKSMKKMTEWVYIYMWFLMNIRLLIEMYYLNSSKVMKFQMNKDQTA